MSRPWPNGPPKRKKKSLEYSQKWLQRIAIFSFVCIVAHYVISACGGNISAEVTVAMITTGLGAFIGYLVYQYKLKDSRNKNRVDADGTPYDIKEDEEE